MTLYEPPVAAAPAPPRRRWLLSAAGPYPWLGFAGALVIAATTPAWYLDQRSWRITLPGLPHDGTRPLTAIAFVASVVALGISWIGLVGRVERSGEPDRRRMKVVAATAALWFVPILLGPPLLSSDVYSYGAQGEMLTRGLDPTRDDMAKLQYGDYLSLTDKLWRTPYGNPYGPVQMGLAAGVVTVTGHNPAWSAFGFKVLALVSVVVAGWAVSDIARRRGASPPVVVALAIANPLVAVHLVGGGHNDAVMMAFLLSGIALAERGRWKLAVVLLTAAALVKLPGGAGLLYVAWCRPGVGARLTARLRSLATAGAAAAALTLAACASLGIGFGWIGAMRNAGTTKGTLSAATQTGFVVAHALSRLGINASEDDWVNVFRFVGLGLAALGCAVVLWFAPRLGALRATGLSLLLVMLLGPVVWPWYLGPLFAVLFAGGLGRWRPSAVVLCAVFAAEVLPSRQSARPVLERQHLVNLLLIAGIAGAALAAPWVAERWRAFRQPARAPSPAGAAA